MVSASEAITPTNMFRQVHANVYNLINDRNNVPLPSGLPTGHKFVYTREPNYEATNFNGFPCITIPDPEYTQGGKVASATKAMTTDIIQIIVMTQDKKSDSSGDPFGREQMADICNSIISTLNNLTNSATLRRNGLSNKDFPSVPIEWPEIDGKPTFRREFSLRFRQMRRIA